MLPCEHMLQSPVELYSLLFFIFFVSTQVLGISELDKTLLVYGYATALIEIGQPEVTERPISPRLHKAPIFAETCNMYLCQMYNEIFKSIPFFIFFLKELAEAQRQFKKLSSSANRTFQSLVHYGLGKVLLKENK